MIPERIIFVSRGVTVHDDDDGDDDDDDDYDDVSSKEGFPGSEKLLAAVCVFLVRTMVMYQEDIQCDDCCYR